MAAYRLKNRGWLPKFNEGRNPFTPKAAAEALEEKMVAPARSVGVQASACPGGTLNHELQRAGSEAGAPVLNIFKPVAKAGDQGSRLKPGLQTGGAPAKPARTGWTTRLNPFRAPEPAPQPASTVQAELSLAGVKVVHNDLADADVEIVPVKARADAPAAAMLTPARQAWEYVGENLLKSR